MHFINRMFFNPIVFVSVINTMRNIVIVPYLLMSSHIIFDQFYTFDILILLVFGFSLYINAYNIFRASVYSSIVALVVSIISFIVETIMIISDKVELNENTIIISCTALAFFPLFIYTIISYLVAERNMR